MKIKLFSLLVLAQMFRIVNAGVDVDVLRSQYKKELEFAFCGIDAESYEGTITESDKRLRQLIDCGYYDISTNILSVCVQIEQCDRDCNGSGRWLAVNRLSALMIEFAQNSQTNVVVRNLFWRWILQVEYMIARLIERKNGLGVDNGLINYLLPDTLFESDNKLDQRFLKRYKRFRDLLIVAGTIVKYVNKKGCVPADIEEVRLLAGIDDNIVSEDIRYSCENGEWQLVGCVKGARMCRRFNVYVPFLDARRYVWEGGDMVFLSSDFSKKRRQLFVGETLNAGTPWACKLDGDMLIRPSESEQIK